MSDPDAALHADTREAVEVLAEAWRRRRLSHPEEAREAWFDALRRMIEARAATVQDVAELGPMGGGGPDEA